MKNNPLVHIIIMGAPGSGKGTQAQKIVESFGYIHLSTGELFRKKYAQQSEETKAGKASIDKGGFFSDEIAYQIIQDFLWENADAKGIVYDGFPRDIVQAEYFLKNICRKPTIIELQADNEELFDRLLQRGLKKHRADDSSSEIIKRRMELYKKLTLPVVDFFRERNLLYSFKSEGEIESIASQIKELLTQKH